MEKKCCGGKCGGAMIAWILMIIGALNWGLVGIGHLAGANWNLVNLIFGGVSWLEAVIYILVGLAGVMSLFKCHCKKCLGMCDSSATGSSQPTGTTM